MTVFVETDRGNYLQDVRRQFNALRDRLIELEAAVSESRATLTATRTEITDLITKYNGDHNELVTGLGALVTALNAEAQLTATFSTGLSAGQFETDADGIDASDDLDAANNLTEADFTGLDEWTRVER